MVLATGAVFFALRYGGTQFVADIAGESIENEAALAGERAPYFDLPDLEGNHVRLSDYTDMPLIIVFWATWNEQAADQLHIIDEYLAEAGSARLVEIVAIDSQEEKSVISSFMRRGGYGIHTLLDARGGVTEEYKVKSMPTIFFVKRDGTIAESFAGVLSERMLVDKIENILK